MWMGIPSLKLNRIRKVSAGRLETGHKSGCSSCFEDAPAGIVAAQRAGMLAVGIGSASALAGADLILPGFGEMAPELLLLTLRDMIFL